MFINNFNKFNYNKKIKIDLKFTFYIFLIFFIISHVYFVTKYRISEFDIWQLNNLNKWTNGHLFVKNNDTKEKIFKLRNCEDFYLISLDEKNNKLFLNNYINYISYKSTLFIETSMLYNDIEAYKKNKYNKNLVFKLVENLNNNFEITKEENIFINEYNVNFFDS